MRIAYFGDFRFPGASSRRLAREIRMARALGHTTVLVPVRTSKFERTAAWHPEIVRAATEASVHLALPSEQVSVDLAVIRHPMDALPAILASPPIEAARVHVVSNQNFREAPNKQKARSLAESLAQHFDLEPTWWPINGETATALADAGMPSTGQNWWPAAAANNDGLLAHTAGVHLVVARETLSSDRDWRPIVRPVKRARSPIVAVPRSADDATKIRLAEWAAQMRSRYALVEDTVWQAMEGGESELLGDSSTLVDGDVLALSMYAWLLSASHSESSRPGLKDVVLRAQTETLSTDKSAHLDVPPRGNRKRTTVYEIKTEKVVPRVMFITSNGAGMGHLTRELGIARALGTRAMPMFFSMSQGVPVVAQFDIPYEYVPFNSAMKMPPEQWNNYFETRLRRAIEAFEPATVVFDGVWPYGGLLRAIRSAKVASVWVRRGMWKPHISPEQLQRAPEFDLVIEPGDYASEYDTGATTRVSGARRVAPVTVLNNEELLSRADARAELGMEDGKRYALITLGAGNINDIANIQDEFIGVVGQLGEDWQPVVTRTAISNNAAREGGDVLELSVYPLARYARAFDFAVSAAGYNSFHEWINAALPTIWVPNHATLTDDQAARARFAGDVGVGIDLAEPSSRTIREAVSRISDGDAREQMRSRALRLRVENGASAAADMISALPRAVRS